MIDFDVSELPQRPHEWAALVRAALAANQHDEYHWIEWKSALDLNDQQIVGQTLAKAIVAMANREPDIAGDYFGGAGVILIGLSDGTLHGVESVDHAQFEPRLTRFIGEDGPRWTPHWIPIDGETVLAIAVGAPRQGDPIHSFRAAAGKITPGTIYVRKGSRSVPADHEDLQRLARRSLPKQVQQSLDIDVEVRYPEALPRVAPNPADLAKYLADERQKLLEPLEAHLASLNTPLGFAAIKGALNTSSGEQDLLVKHLTAETRNPDRFRESVEEYLAEVANGWEAAMDAVAFVSLPAPEFVLINRSNRNYVDVRVQLHVAGQARAGDGTEDPLDVLPRPPKAWGTVNSFSSAFASQTDLAHELSLGFPSAPASIISNGGSFQIEFLDVNLRPRGEAVLDDEIVIVVPAERSEPVVAEWTATASNIDAVASGSFEIEFAASARVLYFHPDA
ncbi:helix-turn-helix domain-containing protein [Salinibacterium sp. ZJ450]|uniref:AlbA family DNA-binding domain-containing protein n=1 Tax=Salinibacterium sp. ZJ450 TaxID=2708338 RepID=UPI00141E12F2|nr:ATP-binding protein [Salinibacterium sp. ZJ450]